MNQPIAETNVPVVDNLYLDMNGIIHNCTHGNDPGRKITEQEMIIKVFGYLEKLFQIVQPQKLLFMAIDGVPPPSADTFWNRIVVAFAEVAVHHAPLTSVFGRDLTILTFSCRCRTPCKDEPAEVQAIQDS